MEFNLQTLMAGGAIAAIAGFWTQIKGILRQISGLLLVQAELDLPLQHDVHYYLTEHYKAVPTGLIRYVTHSHMTPERPVGMFIPFRLPNSPLSVHYKQDSLIVFTGKSLIGLRGLSDLDALVIAASKDAQARRERVTQFTSRFWVENIMGRDRKQSVRSHASSIRENGSSSGSDSPRPPDSPEMGRGLILELHDPLYHKRTDYLPAPGTNHPFANLYFEPHVWSHIEQARQWARMGQWYAERMIPWRRGWMLIGPPGTGKSSLARALAEDLDFPLKIFHLSTLSDVEFLEAWRALPAPCVVLMEDMDAVFHERESNEEDSLSFSTLLNAISGANTQSGLFTIITTNHPEKLDAALGSETDLAGGVSSRPGRVDAVIRLEHITQVNREQMAQRILRDWPHAQATVLARTKGVPLTPCQFQEICVQEAYKQLAQGEPND